MEINLRVRYWNTWQRTSEINNLLAGLKASGTTSVIEPASSRDHTERMLKAFGADISVGKLGRNVVIGQIQLNWSENINPWRHKFCIFLDDAIYCSKFKVLIKNVGLNPTRTGMLNVMDLMGCNYEILDKATIAGEPIGSIKVKTANNLKPFTIEGDILPKLIDEIPISVAACFCDGVSEIKDAQEFRVKEADRLKSWQDNYTNLS